MKKRTIKALSILLCVGFMSILIFSTNYYENTSVNESSTKEGLKPLKPAQSWDNFTFIHIKDGNCTKF